MKEWVKHWVYSCTRSSASPSQKIQLHGDVVWKDITVLLDIRKPRWSVNTEAWSTFLSLLSWCCESVVAVVQSSCFALHGQGNVHVVWFSECKDVLVFFDITEQSVLKMLPASMNQKTWQISKTSLITFHSILFSTLFTSWFELIVFPFYFPLDFRKILLLPFFPYINNKASTPLPFPSLPYIPIHITLPSSYLPPPPI